MALLFMDGFSHYQTSDIGRKWDVVTTAGATWSIVTEGRTDGCIKRVSTSNASGSGYVVKSPTVRQTGTWTPQVSGVCGFALKIDDLSKIDPIPSGAGGVQAFYDNLITVWNGAWGMFGVKINIDGTLSLWQGHVTPSNNVLLGTTIGVISNNTWIYLEFKWTINQTAGNLKIHANGIEIMNFTGALYPIVGVFSPPTVAWTSVYCFGLRSLPGTAPLLITRACDFYLLDTTGTSNNDFLGDVSISYIRPNGVGATSAWTPTPTVPNWQTQDEVPPNDDTDYVTAGSPGTIDIYDFEDIPLTVAPIAIQQCILGRMTLPGSSSIKSVIRQGSTNYESPAQAIPNTTYTYDCFPYDTNPATSATFTRTEINSGQFGVDKVT